jgi:hypothetical protein
MDIKFENLESQVLYQKLYIDELHKRLELEMTKSANLEKQVEFQKKLLENQEKTRLGIFGKSDAEEAKHLLKEIKRKVYGSKKHYYHFV